jgi:adenylate cyclase
VISTADILNGKILIVDDLAPNIALLEQMLRRAGYLNLTATTDSSAVCELHLVNHYDLILLDLMMPGMDGFQVMENLKEIETGSYLPVLVITAQPEQKLRALKAGAKDFVSKPFDLAEVLIRVHNMLEVRLLHQETRQLYERVLAEQKVSKRLLLEVLPQAMADIMRQYPEGTADAPAGLIAEGYAEVTVLFADIVAFTRFSEGASAKVLAGALNDISARFDSQAEDSSFDRQGTTGEAYLASIDLSDAVADRSIRAVTKALDLIEAVDRFNERSRYKLKVRIGLDSSKAKGGKRETQHDL